MWVHRERLDGTERLQKKLKASAADGRRGKPRSSQQADGEERTGNGAADEERKGEAPTDRISEVDASRSPRRKPKRTSGLVGQPPTPAAFSSLLARFNLRR
jgi:hypothetical protein